jgi:V/A-type H+-transporting ATPase subunit C
MTTLKDVKEKVQSALPFESGNYPYVCARVKAKKKWLLSSDVYLRYLQMDIPQIARSIGEGQYAEEILELGAKLSGVDLIEMATRNNLAKVFTQIYEFSEGHLREMISRYLDRWDVWNIKSILRGKFSGSTNEEIWETVVPAGSFRTKFLEELLELETVEEIVNGLEGTIYWEALKEVEDRVEASRTMAPFEDALTHRYYSYLLEVIPPTIEPNVRFRRHIQREIDTLNLKTLLRVRYIQCEIEGEVFVEGGLEIAADDLNEMIDMPNEQLEAKLKGTSFQTVVSPHIKEIEEKGLGDAMRALEKSLIRRATKYSHIHPLSILPVLDYFSRKEREVENIRIIARGKSAGLSNDVIKEMLVV